MSKSESYLVNSKYMGEEPSLSANFSQTEYRNALTWYHYMCSMADAREYLSDYLKNTHRTEDYKRLKSLPDAWLPLTTAWIARIITRGADLPEESVAFLNNQLETSFNKAGIKKEQKKKSAETNVVSIQDRMKDRAAEIRDEISGLVDDIIFFGTNDSFSFYDWLKSREIPAAYVNIIARRYEPWMNEVKDAIAGVDGDLKESYKPYSKKELVNIDKVLSGLVDDCLRYSSVSKKTKKPRKPRTISVEKKLKKFKYQKEDSTFKIASISPEKILGCQELWTFNTRYKTLTVFRAIDRGGLSVKGTTIIGYDEKNSFTKRTGYRPEEYVDRVLKGGKIALRKLMEEMKKSAPLAARINENTILLKVVS